jgi:hypothetical protein
MLSLQQMCAHRIASAGAGASAHIEQLPGILQQQCIVQRRVHLFVTRWRARAPVRLDAARKKARTRSYRAQRYGKSM